MNALFVYSLTAAHHRHLFVDAPGQIYQSWALTVSSCAEYIEYRYVCVQGAWRPARADVSAVPQLRDRRGRRETFWTHEQGKVSSQVAAPARRRMCRYVLNWRPPKWISRIALPPVHLGDLSYKLITSHFTMRLYYINSPSKK